jgi:hypothetical protein
MTLFVAPKQSVRVAGFCLKTTLDYLSDDLDGKRRFWKLHCCGPRETVSFHKRHFSAIMGRLLESGHEVVAGRGAGERCLMLVRRTCAKKTEKKKNAPPTNKRD